MKRLRLETTAPFQGLAELVAYDEGLFENEGLQIEWMDRENGLDKSPDHSSFAIQLVNNAKPSDFTNEFVI
ncbi:MAG TPA: hypothetical protein VIH18_15035 [Candidatus Binatia bacterium]|jgi:hypothetical protein